MKLKIITGKEFEYPFEILHDYKDNKFDKKDLKGIFGKYVIHYEYFHQYAEGITGANHSVACYVKNCGDHMEFFNTRKEASEFKKAHFKDCNIKGRYTPYGNIGAETIKTKVIKITKENIKDIFDRNYVGLIPNWTIVKD